MCTIHRVSDRLEAADVGAHLPSAYFQLYLSPCIWKLSFHRAFVLQCGSVNTAGSQQLPNLRQVQHPVPEKQPVSLPDKQSSPPAPHHSLRAYVVVCLLVAVSAGVLEKRVTGWRVLPSSLSTTAPLAALNVPLKPADACKPHCGVPFTPRILQYCPETVFHSFTHSLKSLFRGLADASDFAVSHITSPTAGTRQIGGWLRGASHQG